MNINQQSDTNIVNQQPLLEPPTQKKRQRLKSIDVYRGITMLGMILVDNQGGSPIWALNETDWNGITTADLIFPAFLFIMGFAVPLAVRKPFKFWRFLLRVCGLFLIGVFINLTSRIYHFELLRIMGVLQRISVVYLILVLLHLATNYGEQRLRKYSVMFVIIALGIYTGVMINFTDEANNCDRTNNLNKLCNFQRWLDLKILTYNHMLKPTDPEGIFSTLSSLFTAFGGYYFSLIMQKLKDNKISLLKTWILYSIFFIVFSIPVNLVMPYNKKLWSASFALITVGISGTALTFTMLTVDILTNKYKGRRYEKITEIICRPFLWLGMNPLAIFVFMDLFAIILIKYIKIEGKSGWNFFYTKGFHSWITNPELCSTVWSLVIALIWILVAYLMFRFKIFIKL